MVRNRKGSVTCRGYKWLNVLYTLFQVKKTFMKSHTDKILVQTDFQSCYNSVEHSAHKSTGQALRVMKMSSVLDTHEGGLRALDNYLWLPSKRTLFYQILVGCNFLTPHDHSKKPKCKFCDNQQEASWKHLFFQCPEFSENGKPKIITRIITMLEIDTKYAEHS